MKLPSIFTVAAMLLTTFPSSAEDLKIGIIGMDTSHVPAFTKADQ
jgi:hypothetical protein